MDGVFLTSLVLYHLLILLNILEHGDNLNNQLATDFLEFVKMHVALLLAFLCTGSSLL